METFITHLTNLLDTHFGNAELSFETFPGGRVGGIMAWAGFDGEPQRERQHRLWTVLRQLPPQEQMQISSILTLTPHEQRGYLENTTEDDF